MDVYPELIKISTALAQQISKKSSTTIWDKIKAIKQKGEDAETISSLEGIIGELIDDKNELIQISQVYEEELITQKLSEDEIDYITNEIIPIFEELIEKSTSSEAKNIQETLDMIKPILSKETFNILQLLGFNFKRAIGEPLTELINALINSNRPIDSKLNIELAILQEKSRLESLRITKDDMAYKRYKKMSGYV